MGADPAADVHCNVVANSGHSNRIAYAPNMLLLPRARSAAGTLISCVGERESNYGSSGSTANVSPISAD